jgi:hypothetical protein
MHLQTLTKRAGMGPNVWILLLSGRLKVTVNRMHTSPFDLLRSLHNTPSVQLKKILVDSVKEAWTKQSKGPTACLLEQAKMMFSLFVRSGA